MVAIEKARVVKEKKVAKVYMGSFIWTMEAPANASYKSKAWNVIDQFSEALLEGITKD